MKNFHQNQNNPSTQKILTKGKSLSQGAGGDKKLLPEVLLINICLISQKTNNGRTHDVKDKMFTYLPDDKSWFSNKICWNLTSQIVIL